MLALEDGEEIARQGCRARQPRDDSGVRRPECGGAARARIRYAGLDFALSGDAGACERVARAARAGMPPPSDPTAHARDTSAPKFAVSCQLQMIPPPALEQPPAELTWRWTGGGGELVTSFAGARVRAVPRGVEDSSAVEERSSAVEERSTAHERTPLFEGSAWLTGEARAAHFLLGGLAVMLGHRLGGAVLHAASVELDAGVIAFVGPSGSGKSTACRHVEGAPLVSVDRLAVVPVGSAWLCHPLPGGTRPVPELPAVAPRWRPLAGVLRVRQSTNGTAIEVPSPAVGVTLLRESTFQAGLGRGAEQELLGALEHLVQHVPVARLALQLGASLKPVLRRWLESQAEERR